MLEGKIKYALYGVVSAIAAKARLTIFDYFSGFIFVVDSSDHERFDEVRANLVVSLVMRGVHETPLLVLANEQDLPNAMQACEVTHRLGLSALHGRHWYVQATCATSGTGLYEGLDWLCNTLSPAKR
ncbi:hypothetical protein AAHC03_019187 [Spirometra sp. Aus1]